MMPAAEAMEDALGRVVIAPPAVPLVANVTAAETADPEAIRRQLVEQVTGMVRWRESVLFMKAHEVELIVEIGAGKVLTGLTRRIDRELQGIAVGTPEGVETLLNTL